MKTEKLLSATKFVLRRYGDSFSVFLVKLFVLYDFQYTDLSISLLRRFDSF